MELKELYVDSLFLGFLWKKTLVHGARGSALCSDLAISIPCTERREHEAVSCTLTSACFSNAGGYEGRILHTKLHTLCSLPATRDLSIFGATNLDFDLLCMLLVHS